MNPRLVIGLVALLSISGTLAACTPRKATSVPLPTATTQSLPVATTGSLPVDAARSPLPSPASPGPTPPARAPGPVGSTANPGPTVPLPAALAQSDWVRARLLAVEELYRPSELGSAWMRGYDFRQMIGQPAWFGSTGFSGYAGAGQAIPRIIVHELSHSMWGAFPVAGKPDLTGQQGPDGVLDVVAAYRADLATFMRQPPDRYEPLRDRFRNMPNLVRGDYPDLYHSGEADLINMTGGDIDLVPPILRRYVQAYYGAAGLGGHDFSGWADAIAWWNGLPGDDRRIAGELFGLQHFPLDSWNSLKPATSTRLSAGVIRVFELEEAQRLIDFAEQLDTVKEHTEGAADAAGINRGFEFWRGYLHEMLGLHRRQPEILRGSTDPTVRDIAAALDFYLDIEGLPPAEQAQRYRTGLSSPYVSDFPFLLRSRALVELFSSGAETDPGSDTGRVVGGYARRLARLVVLADSVLASHGAGAGSARLEAVLGSLTDEEVRSELNILLDLMRESDGPATRGALSGLGDASIARLLVLRPEIARTGEITPERLLAAVGVTRDSPRAEMVAGIRRLTENSSGSFQIDRPYDRAVYALLNERVLSDPALVFEVFAKTGLSLAGWIEDHPDRAARLFGGSPTAGGKAILEASTLRHPVPYLVRALTLADPEVSARVIVELADLEASAQTGAESGSPLDRVRPTPYVPRALNAMAFDSYWISLGAGPATSISTDATLVSELARLKGAAWLEQQLQEAMVIAAHEADIGEVDPDFYVTLIATLRLIRAQLPPSDPAAIAIGRLLVPT